MNVGMLQISNFACWNNCCKTASTEIMSHEQHRYGTIACEFIAKECLSHQLTSVRWKNIDINHFPANRGWFISARDNWMLLRPRPGRGEEKKHGRRPAMTTTIWLCQLQVLYCCFLSLRKLHWFFYFKN